MKDPVEYIEPYREARLEVEEIEAKLKDAKKELDKVEADLIDSLQEREMKSFIHEKEGQFILRTTSFPTFGDPVIKDSNHRKFISWLKRKNLFSKVAASCVNANTIRSFVSEFQNDHEGKLPPGVDVYIRSGITWKRPKN